MSKNTRHRCRGLPTVPVQCSASAVTPASPSHQNSSMPGPLSPSRFPSLKGTTSASRMTLEVTLRPGLDRVSTRRARSGCTGQPGGIGSPSVANTELLSNKFRPTHAWVFRRSTVLRLLDLLNTMISGLPWRSRTCICILLVRGRHSQPTYIHRT